MKKIIHNIAILLSVVTLASSCIRDELEECHTMHINIAVKDKNYFNVNKVDLENYKSEDLPFREYIPTLHYCITDLRTNETVVHSDLITVEGDAEMYGIDLPESLPFGTYSIQVWGGMGNLDPLEDDHSTIAFHPNNSQGHDVYMTCDTIVYSPTSYDDTVWLERTKGKLIIELENLPVGMEYSRMTISGLYNGLNADFVYQGETYVQTDTHWSGDHTVTKTLVTPTTEDTPSRLRMTIHDGSLLDDYKKKNSPKPYDVDLKVNRNELTVVRYVWDEDKGDFIIYVLVGDYWEQIHGMQIVE